tara:strand:+ start:7785 stop:8819 length:1035 start_codon:yes stop_codon:yes gene_type:complete
MKLKIFKFFTIIFFSLLIVLYSSTDLSPEEFALGDETKSYYALDSNNKKIHFSNMDEIEFTDNSELIIFLGNSQTHGVNQYVKGNSNYVEILSKKYPNKNIYAISIPNGSLTEFYIISTYLISNFNIKKIILPVFFDDTRESNVRTEIISFFDSKNQYNFDDIMELMPNKNITESDNIASTQDKSEEFLNNLFEKNSIWKKRESLRVQVFTFLYKLRNTVFFITPSSKRYKIEESYNKNINSLIKLIDLCDLNDVNLDIYIPPIRNDVEIPYDNLEYNAFKLKIKEILNVKKDFRYLNFENIIPGKYWGMKSSTNLLKTKEYDFMHFNFQAHKILADSLQILLK